MATNHTVEQGEHLPRIAARYGFEDYRAVWEHARNASLAELRQNPNVLLPGDRVFIPDKQGKKEGIATGRKHRFKLAARPITLRVVIKQAGYQPVADSACELHVEGATFHLQTDGAGMIERPVAKTAEHGRIVIFDREVPLKIGHLDPVAELSGQTARLNNLGYRAGAPPDADDQQFRSAVEEFQCDHDLTVDGVCGTETQAALVEAHGC